MPKSVIGQITIIAWKRILIGYLYFIEIRFTNVLLYTKERDAGNIVDDLIVKEEICRVVIIFKMLEEFK